MRPRVIEQKLFVMFLEHRMRTFQGTFHANPDYALWYGWSEMQRDLTEIKELAAEMRRTGHAAPATNVESGRRAAEHAQEPPKYDQRFLSLTDNTNRKIVKAPSIECFPHLGLRP